MKGSMTRRRSKETANRRVCRVLRISISVYEPEKERPFAMAMGGSSGS